MTPRPQAYVRKPASQNPTGTQLPRLLRGKRQTLFLLFGFPASHYITTKAKNTYGVPRGYSTAPRSWRQIKHSGQGTPEPDGRLFKRTIKDRFHVFFPECRSLFLQACLNKVTSITKAGGKICVFCGSVQGSKGFLWATDMGAFVL